MPPVVTGSPAGGADSPLDTQRAALFVGRTAEVGLFTDLLPNREGPRVVALTGIGGIGKSSLLHAWERHARDRGYVQVHINGRGLPPSPAAFEAAAFPPDDFGYCCAAGRLITVDSFEQLLPLEGWLRERLLPQLPANTTLVLAGRWTPNTRWRAEPAMARMLVECRLDALSPADADDYLERRGIPSARRQPIQYFARGFPLALALAADWVERNPHADFSRGDAPELIHPMVEWLLEDIDDERQRQALEAGALVQYATEPLLAAMLELPNGSESFDWLARQHHVELHPQGLSVHDLVREPVVSELRWRDPQRYRAMVRRASQHYLEGLDDSSAERGTAAVSACLYTLRQEPYVQHHFQPGNAEYYIDACRREELPRVAEMVSAYEGPEAASRFTQYARDAPDSVAVVRDRELRPQGVALVLTFDADAIATGRNGDDPGVAAFCHYVSEHAPLRGGHIAMFMRFALARDTFQESGPVLSQILLHGNGLYFTPGLSFFALAADISRDWWGTGENADAPLLPDTEFRSGNRRFGLLAHDMRSEPPLQWARNCVDRILGDRPPAPAARYRPRILQRNEFESAVLDALRHYHDEAHLRASALHDSQLLAGQPDDPVEIRRLLANTSRSVLDDGRQQSPHRILTTVYFDAAVGKQIAAAETFCVSERTFRRWLRHAEKRLVEALWQRETRRG